MDQVQLTSRGSRDAAARIENCAASICQIIRRSACRYRRFLRHVMALGGKISSRRKAHDMVMCRVQGAMCRVLVLSAACGLLGASTGASQQPAGLRADNPDRWLAGAIDIHVHSSPDDRERSVDALEAAIMARAHGMRAIVLKNHYDSTVGLVYLVRKQVPGLEVFGGIDLNLPAGGMNPAAVEHMAQVLGGFGCLVWMSTFDAENQVRVSKESRPFVAVSKDGQLLQSTRDVIAVIAKRQLAMATGHVSAQEGLMLIGEARRQGVQRIVVTHAMNTPVEMNVAQMQEAARMGALMEFVGGTMLSADAPARVERFADAIRKVGPEFCILSSDLGQKGNPLPADGLAAFIAAIKAKGFSDPDIDRMTKQNPGKLLGLQ